MKCSIFDVDVSTLTSQQLKERCSGCLEHTGGTYCSHLQTEKETNMKTINLKGNWETRRVWLNGKELSPERSQKVRNHSPDGFNWGYGGSGPAQLALAIMLEVTGKSEGYQDFKFKVIAGLPQTDFETQIDFDY